ncbi:MAG: hypothetical protein B6I38_07600, partial [Anaerolineaceae bacterium 4572_5.1]
MLINPSCYLQEKEGGLGTAPKHFFGVSKKMLINPSCYLQEKEGQKPSFCLKIDRDYSNNVLIILLLFLYYFALNYVIYFTNVIT